MQRYAVKWRRLSRSGKAFFVFAAAWVLLYFTRISPALQVLLALGATASGVLALYKLARRGMQGIIWRLRNRLIVAYLFIAVVPIVLMLLLMGGTSYAVVGQMAVYLVNAEMNSRLRALAFPAEAMARAPFPGFETAMKRYQPILHRNF